MQKRDDDHKERQRIINQHESFIYESQNRLEDEEFIEFSSEEERNEISTLLSENEDWLMDEATNTTPTEDYKQRYLDMKTAMNRVENRIDEHKRKIEEERKKKEEEERKKKEEEEAAKKKQEEEEEAKKKQEEEEKKEAEATTETETETEIETETEKKDNVEETQQVKTPQGEESDDFFDENSFEGKEEDSTANSAEASADEGFCSIDGDSCSEEI